MIHVPEDRRRETLRRLQVGGVGLLLVALLIALSTLLIGQSGPQSDMAKAQTEATGVSAPVAPAAGASTGATIVPPASAASAPASSLPAPAPVARSGPTPVVPDLQPDPALRGQSRR